MTFSQSTSICSLFTGGSSCLGSLKVHISIRMITFLSSRRHILDYLAGTLNKNYCLNFTLQTERDQEMSQLKDNGKLICQYDTWAKGLGPQIHKSAEGIRRKGWMNWISTSAWAVGSVHHQTQCVYWFGPHCTNKVKQWKKNVIGHVNTVHGNAIGLSFCLCLTLQRLRFHSIYGGPTQEFSPIFSLYAFK